MPLSAKTLFAAAALAFVLMVLAMMNAFHSNTNSPGELATGLQGSLVFGVVGSVAAGAGLVVFIIDWFKERGRG